MMLYQLTHITRNMLAGDAGPAGRRRSQDGVSRIVLRLKGEVQP